MRTLVGAALLAAVTTSAAPAAQLPASAVAAFDAAVERIGGRLRSGDTPFLRIDALAGRELDGELAVVRRGGVSIRELDAARLDDGILHHWVGTAFVPGGRLEGALALSRDYRRYGTVFAPDVVAARLLAAPAPDTDRITMRLRKHKLVTLTYDVVQTVRYGRPGADRAWSEAVSTEVHEVRNAGTSGERPRPTDEGRLWRLCTWWRYREGDGGLWIENESLVLTDDVRFPANLVVGPLLEAGPREGVERAVRSLRRELEP